MPLRSWYLQTLEDEGAKRTTTRVLNIIQKILEPVIRLKVDEEQGNAKKRCMGQMGNEHT